MPMNDPRISLEEHFYEKGFLCVPSVLDAATVASFQAEVGSELYRDYGVDLGATHTWPRKRARRVFETLPVGDGDHDLHWRALRDPTGPLAQALDKVVGPGQWELNFNVAAADGARSSGGAAGVEVRHWYCPVAFPEEVPDEMDYYDAAVEGGQDIADCSSRLSRLPDQKDAPRMKSIDASSSLPFRATLTPAIKRSIESIGESPPQDEAGRSFCSGEGPRVAELMSCAEEAYMRGPLRDAAGLLEWETLARKRWQPVSRRRVLSKGWHLDVGPGFPNDGLRTLRGDPRQGVVILLLLSDCAPGCGGTALIPGSHLSVMNELESSAASTDVCMDNREVKTAQSLPRCNNTSDTAHVPPSRSTSSGEWTHQALNTAFVQRLRALTEAGRVQLECSACRGHHPNCQGHATNALDSTANLREKGDERSAKAAAPETLRASFYSQEKEKLSVVRVVQVSGRAGDVVLMHPLLLHSGTMNCGHMPRLMANGMARIKPGAFLHRSAVAAAVATSAEDGSNRDLHVSYACADSTPPSRRTTPDSEGSFPTTIREDDYFNPIIAATLVSRSRLQQRKRRESVKSNSDGCSNNESESFFLGKVDPFAGTLTLDAAGAPASEPASEEMALRGSPGTEETPNAATTTPTTTISIAAAEKAAYKAREQARRQVAAAAREKKRRSRLDRKSQGSYARSSPGTNIEDCSVASNSKI